MSGLAKFQSQARRIHDVAVAYGAQGALKIDHLNISNLMIINDLSELLVTINEFIWAA